MSAAACRQWAAVNTIRGASTMPVQKPEPSAPRVSTITTWSPNGDPSCAGPTIAWALGAPKRAKSVNKAAGVRFRPELMIPGLARPRRLAQDGVSADRLYIEADAFIRRSAAAGKTCPMARVSTILTLLAVGAFCLGASPARAAEAT